MNDEDLAKIDKLMASRDRWMLLADDERRNVLTALADEVPGLTQAVRMLKKELRYWMEKSQRVHESTERTK